MGIKARYLRDKNGKFYPHAHADATYDRDGKKVGDVLSELAEEIENLKYKAITITSFSNNVGNVENGRIINDITLSWTTSKTPSTLTLDGVSLDVSQKSKTINNLNLTKTKTWTLKVTDNKGATATKTTSINFMNGVYYGATEEPDNYNRDFILSLTKKLSSGKYSPFTVNAGIGQNIFYCLPSSLGKCTFVVNNFEGGFAKVSTINFENSHGYKIDYDIWKSDYKNLGTTTVTVS